MVDSCQKLNNRILWTEYSSARNFKTLNFISFSALENSDVVFD